MSSQLQIVNLAFSHLGEPSVDEITQDPKPANTVKALAHWDMALEVACTRAPWLCCLERLTVARQPNLTEDAANGVDGDWAYAYVFMLPAETLRIWYVDDCRQAFAWERSRVIQGKFVGRPVIRATTAGPLKVALTRRTIPELLTPLLADALAYDLASRLAGPIQSDAILAATLAKKAETAYAAARGAETSEFGGQETLLSADNMTLARLGAGSDAGFGPGWRAGL